MSLHVKRVKVCRGEHEIGVRPWTMSQRSELKPRLLELIAKMSSSDMSDGLSLATLFLTAEEEVTAIIKLSSTLPEGLTWDEMYFEDIPILAQAVWDMCIIGEGASGLAGKLLGVVADQMTSPPAKPNDSSGPASDSSRGAGGPTLNASETV